MNYEQRKLLQNILERAITMSTSEAEKTVLRMSLSLVKELNERDELRLGKDKEGEGCDQITFSELILSVLNILSIIKVPERVDEKNLKALAIAADGLSRLSVDIHVLLANMKRLYGDGANLKRSNDILQ